MKYTPTKTDDYSLFNNEDFFDNWFDFPLSKFGRNMQKMKTDVIDAKERYIINIDIPGYDKKDIKVHVGDNYLTVYVNKEDETVDKSPIEGKYIFRERYVGTASRSFYIGNVSEDKIKAKYENGTLTLTFPKQSESEKETKKWIAIE